MPATRLIPATDDAEFPYEELLAHIWTLDGVAIKHADLSEMIAAGKRSGWSAEMIAANEALQRTGRCRDVMQSKPPYLYATLYLDNLYIMYWDNAHRIACAPLVASMANKLGVRIWQQESPYYVERPK